MWTYVQGVYSSLDIVYREGPPLQRELIMTEGE